MLTREENERFTRVGPGTPAGEVLRRYWWPIGFTDHVQGPRPQTVRLLGEDFVLFRDATGRLGLLELLCAHRRTSLALGRVEERGVRCCYHGWLFDAAGRCLEQPCEEPNDVFLEHVRLKSYPVQEVAGLVFAYVGPLPAPLLPKYDLLQWQGGKSAVWSIFHQCNWLQTVENACDVSHVPWLHAGPYPEFAGKRPRITWERTPWGLHYEMRMEGFVGADTGEMIFPGHNRFASGRHGQASSLLKDRNHDVRHNLAFRVPLDDVTTCLYVLGIYPDHERIRVTVGERKRMPRGEYETIEDGWWNIASRRRTRGPGTDNRPFDRVPRAIGPRGHPLSGDAT